MTNEERKWLDYYRRQAEEMRDMPSFRELLEKEEEERGEIEQVEKEVKR